MKHQTLPTTTLSSSSQRRQQQQKMIRYISVAALCFIYVATFFSMVDIVETMILSLTLRHYHDDVYFAVNAIVKSKKTTETSLFVVASAVLYPFLQTKKKQWGWVHHHPTIHFPPFQKEQPIPQHIPQHIPLVNHDNNSDRHRSRTNIKENERSHLMHTLYDCRGGGSGGGSGNSSSSSNAGSSRSHRANNSDRKSSSTSNKKNTNHKNSTSASNKQAKTKSKKKKKRDYYEILGLSPKKKNEYTEKDITKAYRKMALKYHPDKNKDGTDDEFKEISEAYDVLSDPNKREFYHRYGHNAESPTTPFPQSSSSFQANDGSFGNIPPEFFQSFFPSGSSSSTFFSFGNPPGHHAKQQRRNSPPPFGTNNDIPFMDIDEMIRQMMMNGSNDNQHRYNQNQNSYHSSMNRNDNNNNKVYEQVLTCTLEELYHGTIKKRKVSYQGYHRIYQIPIEPGYKMGTKLKYQPTSDFPYPMTFIIRIAKHPHFDIVNHNSRDLIYHYDRSQLKLNSQNNNEQGDDEQHIMITIPLLNGTTYTRKIVKKKLLSLRSGTQWIIPHYGMPYPKKKKKKQATSHDDENDNGENEYGNLIIQFI